MRFLNSIYRYYLSQRFYFNNRGFFERRFFFTYLYSILLIWC